MDLAAPVFSKIDDLLSRMTLEEKAGQLNQSPNMNDVPEADIAAGRIGSVICSASAFAGNEKPERVELHRGVPDLEGHAWKDIIRRTRLAPLMRAAVT